MPEQINSAYAGAGVDVEAGYQAVRLMKSHVRKTFGPDVLAGIGGFGGLFSLKRCAGMEHPVLVSGTDGVGTKLKLAFLQDKHDTVGIDCVAMCVNDIVCSGAQPLFFLDYIACGKLIPQKIEAIVKGVAEGCGLSGCSLVGGETAEHPGMMPEDEYDLAGFAVGLVELSDIIDGSRIKPGDVVVGLASSGLHSNGFSLVRKLYSQDELRANSELLTPTRLYVSHVDALRKRADVKGLAHITGGGFFENIPRMLPDGLGVIIDGEWPVPPVFEDIRKRGGVSRHDMFNTYNMGIGMTAAVPPEQAADAVDALIESGCPAYVIGRVAEGTGVQLAVV